MLVTINQYQARTYNYPNVTLGLTITPFQDNVNLIYNGVDYDFEVDVITTAGVYVFTVLDALLVPVDTITLTVTAVAPSITYNKCISESIPLTALPPAPVGVWQLSGNYYPEWLILAFGYAVPTVPVIGTFYVLFQDSIDPTQVYLIEFIFDSCLEEYDFCTPYDINIVWLNRAGGWSSYCFKGKKTYQVQIGNKATFKDANGLLKYYKVEDVFDAIAVLSGEIPVSHSPFIKGLKYSIQAFIKWTSGFIPILIEDKDFDWYADGDGLMIYNIQVKYSSEKLIQTQ